MTTNQDKPCICIISAVYTPRTGGVEVFTHNLANELALLGWRVIVVASNIDSLPSYRNEGGVEVVRLPCHPLINGRLPLNKKNTEFKELMRWLSEQKIDRIHINTRFFPLTKVGVAFAESKGVRPVVMDHGSAYLVLGNKLIDPVIAAYERFITKRLKRHDIDFYGVSAASVRWLTNFNIEAKGAITNAIDAPRFRESASSRDFRKELGLASDAFVVAYAGRLTPEKGVKELVAAAHILEGKKDIHFLLAGDGFLAEEIREVPKNVHFLGRTSREDIAALFTQAEVFCMPTRSEGFSTSLLEAAVCECVPVITNVGGVEELIPNESYGIILEDKNPLTIAEAIVDLYEDRKKGAAMARKIRARAEKDFTLKKTAQLVLEATQKAVDR